MKGKQSDILFMLICTGALAGFIAYKVKQKKDNIASDIWDWF